MLKGGAIFQCVTNLQVTKSVRYKQNRTFGRFYAQKHIDRLLLDPYPLRSSLRSSRHDVKIIHKDMRGKEKEREEERK